MGCVVLCFTLGQRPVLLVRQWVVPCGWRCWYRDTEKQCREYLQNSSLSFRTVCQRFQRSSSAR